MHTATHDLKYKMTISIHNCTFRKKRKSKCHWWKILSYGLVYISVSYTAWNAKSNIFCYLSYILWSFPQLGHSQVITYEGCRDETSESSFLVILYQDKIESFQGFKITFSNFTPANTCIVQDIEYPHFSGISVILFWQENLQYSISWCVLMKRIGFNTFLLSLKIHIFFFFQCMCEISWQV